MNIKTKKLLFFGTLAVSIFGFVGCGPTNSSSSSNSTSNNPSTNPISDHTSVNPSTSTSSSVEERIPTEKVDAFVSSLADNFTLEGKMNGTQSKYLFAGDKIYDAINENYTTLENDTYYVYAKEADDFWHKNFADDNQQKIFEMPEMITKTLNSATWESYDSNTGIFKGYINITGTQKIPLSFKIDADGATLMSGNNFADFSNIGKTNVSLPENVKDNTIVSDKIYENGKFNIVLMNEVLENWFKGDNQYGKDFVSAKFLNSDLIFDKVAFVNPSLNNLQIGLFYTSLSTSNNYFCTADFTDTNLYDGLKNGTISTSDDFQTYLRQMHKGKFNASAEIAIDPEMTQEDFNKMTTNIFNRLAEVGYQGRDISNDGTKVEGLNQDDIIFGFATVKSDIRAGLGLGYKREWTHYYLVNDGNDCKWIEIGVAATTNSNGDNYSVIQNRENRWYVTAYEEIPLDKGNANLYTSNIETKNSKEL